MQDKGKQLQADPVLEQALSHPSRLAMLGYLMERQGTGTKEAELAEEFGLPVPKVKYHLSILRGADLIAHIDGQGQDRYIAAASVGL